MSDSVFLLILLCGVIAGLKLVAEAWLKEKKREQRRRFYRVEYLKSDDWKRKRWVVRKRDGHRCVYCGGEQVKFTTSVMRGGILGENRLSGWCQPATRVIANNMAVDLSVVGI